MNEYMPFAMESSKTSVQIDIPSGEEYCLTTLNSDDDLRMQEILSRGEVGDALINVPKPYTLSHAECWCDRQRKIQERMLACTTKEERQKALFDREAGNVVPLQVIRWRKGGEFVGACSLTPRFTPEGEKAGEQICELGYYIAPEHAGKGVMKGAVRALLEHAAKEYCVKRVFAVVAIENGGSSKVISTLAKEGTDVQQGCCKLKWLESKREGRSIAGEGRTWMWNISEHHEM